MSNDKQSKTYLPSVYDKDGKVDINKFRPSAADLIAMTPSQKQTIINRLKIVNKMAVKQDEQDPEKIKQKVQAGELNPCDAHKQILNVKGPKILSM